MSWYSDLGQSLPQILSAAGGITALIAVFKVKPEVRQGNAEASVREADANRVAVDTAVGLLEPLRQQVAFLGDELAAAAAKARQAARDAEAARAESVAFREEAKAFRAEITALRARVAQLVRVITDAGLAVPPAEEPPPDLPGPPRRPRRRQA